MINKFFLVKVVSTALLVALISEIGKRSALFSSILASLPLLSILSLIWIHQETHNPERIAEFCHGVLLMLLPSFVFFIMLPLLLKWGLKFYVSLPLACAVMFVTYNVYVWGLKKLGVDL